MIYIHCVHFDTLLSCHDLALIINENKKCMLQILWIIVKAVDQCYLPIHNERSTNVYGQEMLRISHSKESARYKLNQVNYSY